jgi:hypothetical protein
MTQEALQQENELLRAALRIALQGINDWLHLYAPDMCSEAGVAEASRRVHEHGTLAYIAGLNEVIGNALETNSPNKPA